MKRVLKRCGHRRRNRRIAVRVFIFLLCSTLLLSMLFFRCRPIMTAFAESQAVWTATKVANQTAARVLQEYADLCAQTVSVTYDENQVVSSVMTNTVAINTVRTKITEQAITEMESFSHLSVALPLGTLTGWDWFSGWGPLLTFPVSFTATVLSDVSSALVSEGINQSVYRVLMHLEISLYVVSPAGRTTVGARVNYPLAEAVLLGEVPDNLTEVYGDDQSLLGQIFDYGMIE